MAKTETKKTVRTTVSLPEEDHAELERIAVRHKVSVAWVVREAVSQYLNAEAPLFRQSRREGD